MRRAISSSLGARFGGIPRLALLVGEIGGAIAVFGAMAVSTQAIIRLLQHGTEGQTSLDVLGLAGELTTDVLQVGTDILLAFPYVDVLWALLVTAVVVGGEWAYQHWYVWTPLLGVGALLIVALDRRVTADVDVQLYQNRRDLPLLFLGALLLVWSAGVIPAAIGRLADAPTLGALAGFSLASVLASWLVVDALRAFWRRIRIAARMDWAADGESLGVAVYLAVRRVVAAVAVVLSPLVPLYLAVLVGTGRLGRIWYALWTAPMEAKVLVVTTVVGLVGALGWQAQAAWPDVRAAVVETIARRRVRAALFTRALPWAGIGIGYVAGYALSRSIPFAIVIAAVVGVGARGLYVLAMRARHRASLLGDVEPLPSTVLVEAYGLPDADGDRHLLVRLNGGTELAFDDVDRAVDVVSDVAISLSEDGRAEPTVAEWFARDLQQHGIVDRDETERRLRRAIHEDALQLLRGDDGTVDLAELESELSEYPESVWRELLIEWRRRGIVRERAEYVTLERDPFRQPV
jgi:hypothetical protein